MRWCFSMAKNLDQWTLTSDHAKPADWFGKG